MWWSITWKKFAIIAACVSVAIAGITVGILFATGAFKNSTSSSSPQCAPLGEDPFSPDYGTTGNCCGDLVRVLEGEKYICKEQGEDITQSCASEGEVPNTGGKGECCAGLTKVSEEGGGYVCKKEGTGGNNNDINVSLASDHVPVWATYDLGNETIIKIMTYNVLTQDKDNDYPTNHVFPTWNERKANVKEIIFREEPDIVILQETSTNMVNNGFLDTKYTEYTDINDMLRGSEKKGTRLYYKTSTIQSVTKVLSKKTGFKIVYKSQCNDGTCEERIDDPYETERNYFIVKVKKNNADCYVFGGHAPTQHCIDLQKQYIQKIIQDINDANLSNEILFVAGADWNWNNHVGNGHYEELRDDLISDTVLSGHGFKIESTRNHKEKQVGYDESGRTTDFLVSNISYRDYQVVTE